MSAMGVSDMGYGNETRLGGTPSHSPHSNSLLAVGSKVGVLLWNVDPSLPTSRFVSIPFHIVLIDVSHLLLAQESFSCFLKQLNLFSFQVFNIVGTCGDGPRPCPCHHVVMESTCQ